MLAVQLVAAVRSDEEHTSVAKLAREVAEELERRLIGPVQILDDDRERGAARDLREKRGARQIDPIPLVLVDVGALNVAPRGASAHQSGAREVVDDVDEPPQLPPRPQLCPL